MPTPPSSPQSLLTVGRSQRADLLGVGLTTALFRGQTVSAGTRSPKVAPVGHMMFP